MKTELIYCCSVVILGAALALSLPALGQDTTDMLSKSLDLVHQVENPTGNPPTDAQRIDLLSQAITMAQQAPNHRLKGHRVLAIQAIRSAIAEIRAGDPNHQAAVYLRTADTELGTSIELAAAAEPSGQSGDASVSSPPVPSSPAAPPSTSAPMDGTSPQEVITRLVANASKKPPGPVENDVTEQTVNTATAALKSAPPAGGGSLRDSIVSDFIEFTLEGPLTSLNSDDSAALFYGPIKLTDDELANHSDVSDDVSFSDSGGYTSWIGSKTKDDAHVIATFCLMKQHGLWKVHAVYLSNDILGGSDKAFIIRQLTDFAKNPSGKSEPSKSVAPVAPLNISYVILHNFGDGSVAQDGENPCGSLVQGPDGNLFGATQELTIDRSEGGTTVLHSGKRGTLFKMTPEGKVTVLHVFTPKDPDGGGVPESSLTPGIDGNLYGAIPGGGENGCGYFFKITAQGVLTPLHQFGDPKFKDDPRGIHAPLVQGPDDDFYGTDDFGGAAGHGSVFKITAEGVVTTLHSFSDGTVANDGAMCRNPVTFGPGGDLYGTTFSGPLKGTMPDFKGILFKITSDGKYMILHRFADGTIPNDGKGSGKVGLFMAGDHTLYGTTESGGSGSGNFFKFTPEGAVTILHVFGGTAVKDGAFPQPTLVEARDGNFYGATSAGGFQENGTLFKMTPEGAITILHNFGDGTIPNDGIAPGGGLVLARDGYFYGTTTQGGSTGKGTLFRIKVP